MPNVALICGGVSCKIENINLDLSVWCLLWFSIICTPFFHDCNTFWCFGPMLLSVGCNTVWGTLVKKLSAPNPKRSRGDPYQTPFIMCFLAILCLKASKGYPKAFTNRYY